MIDTRSKDEARASRSMLETALRAAGAVVLGKAVKCPFHHDEHKSGAIYEKGGAWHYACHAGSCKFQGDVFDVIAKSKGQSVGETLKQELPQQNSIFKKPKRVYADVSALQDMALGLFPAVEAIYQYTNPANRIVEMIVIRCKDKDGTKHFLQCRPEGEGFVMGAPEGLRPIYNRGRLLKAEWAICVEGEKCVHALHDIGIVAVTSPGGANGARKADWSPCAGKIIYLWPDNDEAGLNYMRDVSEVLEKLAPPPRLKWIDPEALDTPAKGDCVDFIEVWGEQGREEAARAVGGVLASARASGAAAEVRTVIDETIAGTRKAVAGQHEILSDLTQALLPGAVVMVCGIPGAGKSIWLLDEVAYWHEAGIPVALYELEHDRDYHLLRFAAQRSNQSKITDARWVKNNPAEARAIVESLRDRLDSFGTAIFTAPDEIVSLGALGEWVVKMADAGKRIIAIDPITAAQGTSRPWEDDLKFLIKGKSAVRRNGASLILVTHPKTNQKQAGLSALAGGAAYSRFSQTVLWLHRLANKKTCWLHRADGVGFSMDVQRVMKIFKASNGRGDGQELAMELDPSSLRFTEQGRISRTKKPDAIDAPDEPTDKEPRELF